MATEMEKILGMSPALASGVGTGIASLGSSLLGAFTGGKDRKSNRDTQAMQRKMMQNELNLSTHAFNFLKEILGKGTTINPEMFQKILANNKNAMMPTLNKIFASQINKTGVRSPYSGASVAGIAGQSESQLIRDLLLSDVGAMQGLQKMFASKL